MYTLHPVRLSIIIENIKECKFCAVVFSRTQYTEEHMDKSARLNWLASICIAAIAMLISILLARSFAADTSTTLDKAILLPCTGDREIEILGDGVVYSDGTALHALNQNGSQIWSSTIGADMSFSVAEGGVAAWSGDKLFLLNGESGSPYYSGSLGKDIISARLGETYAAVLTGTESDATLLVLERGGSQVDAIPLAPELVMDYGFFSDGAILWVMTLNTEGTTPLSTVSTYRPGRTLAGSVTDPDQTVYRVFFQSRTICAVGSTYTRFYDYNGNENVDDRLLVYGWYLTAVGGSEDKPLMAFAPINQTDVSLAVSDVRIIHGDTDKIIRMPFTCSSIAASGNTVYGVNQQYVMIYEADSLKPVTYALPVRCDRLIGITGDRSLAMVSGNEVYLIPLN